MKPDSLHRKRQQQQQRHHHHSKDKGVLEYSMNSFFKEHRPHSGFMLSPLTAVEPPWGGKWIISVR